MKVRGRVCEGIGPTSGKGSKRERVIDSLHRETMIWMDRFAFTLNGSQELPSLLAKAKTMADMYLAPEEVHGLLNYC